MRGKRVKILKKRTKGWTIYNLPREFHRSQIGRKPLFRIVKNIWKQRHLYGRGIFRALGGVL